MLKKIFLPFIFFILAYGFWLSPDFKEISAGVAIFLFGMIALEQGFTAFTGGALEKILKVATNKKWKSVGFGVLTTTVMQSSSLVSVITISFLSAGMLELAAGIGIIFGANLGTTTGAWLVAGLGLKVKISAYAMPMLVFGVILILQKSKPLKGAGYILAGLGFLFLGISYMKEGFDAFKGTLDLSQFAMSGITGLLVFSLIGIVATVIMQSSHATLVLIITALAASQITYENALALAIGANVGTTITALIGAMSANIAGKRLAGAHLVFNLVTGVIAIVFLNQFLLAVDWISQLAGIAADDYTLKLAVFHTLFNLIGVVVMWPFVSKLVQFLEQVLVDKSDDAIGAKYLHEVSVDFPETAVEAVRNETMHVYQLSLNVLCDGISLKQNNILNADSLRTLVKQQRRVFDFDIDEVYENKIKGIYSEIIAFISKASFSWEVQQSESIHWLRAANLNIVEAIKDMKHLRKNMVRNMNHQNDLVQNQYDFLRLYIAQTIKELEQIRALLESEQDDILLLLDTVKVDLKEMENTVNTDITVLLQQDLVSPKMATSLINDSRYAFSIANNLIAMASTLYAMYDKEHLKVEREVLLDKADVEDIVSEGQHH